ncbi:hypothetical protein [Actinomycetospora sp. NBRC 106375]|nr:hypothetical protein [Actinomycetospora sp. NBRC 106375]
MHHLDLGPRDADRGRGCPEPLVIPEAGHVEQEHGRIVARRALARPGDV